MSLVDTYKALADESRLRLLHILEHGTFSVQELTSALGLGQSTVSHHLKILQQAHLLHCQREGTWAYYNLANTADDLESSVILNSCLKALHTSANGLQPVFAKDLERIQEIHARRRDRARQFFESVAPSWREMRSEAQGSEFDLVELTQRISPKGTLADLGCGSGVILERILPRAGQTIAVDYAQAMLEEARKNLGDHAATVDFRLGSLEHLPLADGSIDTAIACMVLHHVAEPREALADVFRALAPGGELLIVDLVAHQNELMRERFADLWLGFDLKIFRRWLKQIGFELSEIELLGSKQEIFLLTGTKPKRMKK